MAPITTCGAARGGGDGSKKRDTRLTIPEILDLLGNDNFCNEVYNVTQQIAKLYTALPEEELKTILLGKQTGVTQGLETQFKKIVGPFIQKWDVPPPPLSAVVDTSLEKHKGLAIMSGLWGVIPVFPWTKEKDVSLEVKRIKETIGKRHVDTMKNKQKKVISSWLKDLGFSNKEISRDYLGTREGLERLTDKEAINSIDFEEEQVMLRQFMQDFLEQGLDEAEARKKAESAIYRKLRGSEAPASASVRKAIRRYQDYREAEGKSVISPAQLDPISYPITMLLRAHTNPLENIEEVKRWLEVLLKALQEYPIGT